MCRQGTGIKRGGRWGWRGWGGVGGGKTTIKKIKIFLINWMKNNIFLFGK